MTASLKSVQWIRIADLVVLFAERNRRIPRDIIADELRRGWFKWTNEQRGVPGFRCGQKLTTLPPDAELPTLNDQASVAFALRFAHQQEWAIPLALAGQKLSKHGKPGRPTKRMPEIMAEHDRREKAGKLEKTVKKTAETLRAWAKAKFASDDIASVDTIANKISSTRKSKSA